MIILHMFLIIYSCQSNSLYNSLYMWLYAIVSTFSTDILVKSDDMKKYLHTRLIQIFIILVKRINLKIFNNNFETLYN